MGNEEAERRKVNVLEYRMAEVSGRRVRRNF